MASFQNISIRNKLTVIQTIATFIAVLLCCVVFVYNDISAFKDSSKSNKYSIAEIVGENSIAALVFNDKDAANKILLHFNDNPSILNAVILDKSGKEFARYIKKGEETFPFTIPDGASVIMEKFFEQKFIVSYRIFQEKEFIGTVMLRAELTDLPTIILKYVKVAIVVLLLSIVTALVISVFFQRIITKPLLSLVKKAKEVSETDNYSIRSSFKGADEMGVLSEGFNNMLERIEKTQSALKESNETLEQRVKERTADLTKTQATLQLSEEKYRKIVEEVGDVIYSSDFKGYFTYVNPVSEKLTGYSEKELLGRHFLELVAPDWRKKAAEFYKEQFDKKITETLFEFPIATKTGERRWVEQAIIQSIEGDRITGYQGIVRDITERKKDEEKLKENDEKIRKLSEFQNIILNGTDYAIITTAASDGIITSFNKGAEKMLGYKAEELIGKNSPSVLHDKAEVEARAKVLTEELKIKVEPGIDVFHIKSRLGTKIDVNEWTYIRKDGSRILVELSITTLKNKDNGIIGYLGIAKDITAMKKANQELKNSNDRFLKIFENNSFGMVLVNLETNKFQYVNGFFLEKFGYSREEVIGKTATELTIIEPESYEKVITLFKQQGYVTDFEALVRKKNGEIFWSSSSLQIIKINDVDFFLSSFFDITDRKKSEEIIKQKSEELANTNIELEQFVYVASHDLQEPLRTISNFVSLLEKKYAGNTDKGTEQYLNFIVDATFRMRNLIKDLLDLSRTGRNVVFSEVDCNEALKEVIANMEASIKEKNAKIDFQKLPVLKGDPIKLKQLFQNLISNAIKFVKKDVVPEITITVEEKNTEYLFAIKDNGIGIEEQSFKKLFIIFQRLNTASEYPGTGIGLATCKKIVALHNGKIWVESKFGEGSTFYFTISKKLEAPPGLPQGEEKSNRIEMN